MRPRLDGGSAVAGRLNCSGGQRDGWRGIRGRSDNPAYNYRTMTTSPDARDFPEVCPNCGGKHITPVGQKNNFDSVEEQGLVGIGTGHQTTTRTLLCSDCGHTWDVTVPYQGE